MTNPYESPTLTEEPLELLAGDRAARGEQIGWEYSVLFVLALGGVVLVNTGKLAALQFGITIEGLAEGLKTIPVAAGLAAIPLAASRVWHRAGTFPIYLGHWLLLSTGFSWIVMQCYDAWNAQLWENHDQSLAEGLAAHDPTIDSHAVHALATIVATTMHWLGIRSLRRDRLCQAYLATVIAGMYWMRISPMIPGVSNTASGLVVLPISLAVIVLFSVILVRDLRQPKTKDPMHWVGIGSILLAVIASILSIVAAVWQKWQSMQ